MNKETEEFDIMDIADLQNDEEEIQANNTEENTEKAIKSSLFSSLTLFSIISVIISFIYTHTLNVYIQQYFKNITKNIREQQLNVDFGSFRASELDFYTKYLNSIISTVAIITMLFIAYIVTKKATRNVMKWMIESKLRAILYVIFITIVICILLTLVPYSFFYNVLKYVPSLTSEQSTTALFAMILLFSILSYILNNTTRRGLSPITIPIIFIVSFLIIEYLPAFIFRNLLYTNVNYCILILLYFLIKLIYQMLKIRTLSNDFDDYQDFIEETIKKTNNKNAIVMHKMFNQETTTQDIARYLAVLSYF